jgi:hypothetical protein
MSYVSETELERQYRDKDKGYEKRIQSLKSELATVREMLREAEKCIINYIDQSYDYREIGQEYFTKHGKGKK